MKNVNELKDAMDGFAGDVVIRTTIDGMLMDAIVLKIDVDTVQVLTKDWVTKVIPIADVIMVDSFATGSMRSLREYIATSPTLDGVKMGKANGQPIAPMNYADAFLPMPKSQRDAYDRWSVAFFADYRRRQAKAMKDPAIQAERAAERRAAFGPGVVVVDVITGRKFTT